MLPAIIIGGVALAATGYGIKRLLEDGDIMQSDLFTQRSYSTFDEFSKAGYELTHGVLEDLRTALTEIKNNSNENVLSETTHNEMQYEFSEISDATKENFKSYTDILKRTQNYINKQLDTLDKILVNSSNYEVYSETEKELVNELSELHNTAVKVLSSKVTNDGKTVARDVNRGFEKLQKALQTKPNEQA